MTISLVMPQLGESVVEGTIGKWLVKEGDRVVKDQPICEVTTDKAQVEVPAPAAGVVEKLLVAEGTTVPVGALLLLLSGAAAPVSAPRPAAAPVTATPATVIQVASVAAQGSAPPAEFSPVVRRLAREHGVDLTRIRGTGQAGRVTRRDVEAAVAAQGGGDAPAASSAYRPPAYQARPGDRVVPFDRRRRLIAEHMVYSHAVAAHAATVTEVDLDRVVRLRAARKEAFLAEGISLSYLPFVAFATAAALREIEGVNARVLQDAYVLLAEIHLGIAVETDKGLIVPVVHRADELDLRSVARAIGDLTEKARTGKLAPDDVTGGTFSISNPGREGNLFGIAILNQPQVGILRVGEIVRRPVAVTVGGVERIEVRPVMYLCLSYDHRIVDGALANRFLRRIRERIEAADFAL